MTEQFWPSWLPLREDLKTLSPYGAPQLPAEASLNTNENPYSPSAQLAAAIAEKVAITATKLNRYPDRDAIALRKGLANFINEISGTNFSEKNIWAANGSNEIIQSLFLAFSDRPALGFNPSYSMHPLIAKVTKVQWRDGGRRADFTLDAKLASREITQLKPGLTFITTPNNPTGTVVSIEDIKILAEATLSVNSLLIIDEAYAEFSDEPSAVTLLDSYPHIVVIRTMSKAFAFAGARLGYLVASPQLVSSMLLVRLPYHLSALTQAAAEVALEFRAELLGTVQSLRKSRDQVASQLELMGLRVLPSKANFILFSGFNAPSAQIWQKLLEKGVLIRDVGLSGYLRVSIGTEAENDRFISALKTILTGDK